MSKEQKTQKLIANLKNGLEQTELKDRPFSLSESEVELLLATIARLEKELAETKKKIDHWQTRAHYFEDELLPKIKLEHKQSTEDLQADNKRLREVLLKAQEYALDMGNFGLTEALESALIKGEVKGKE